MENKPKEWSYVKLIQDKVQRTNPQKYIGLGDDAFVFKNYPGYSVLCQDMMVENTHFWADKTSPQDLGHKALAINLSDICAMGARPHFIQVSLGLPPGLGSTWINDFYEGMCNLADIFECEIIGGDLVRSEKIVIDVSVHGSTLHPLSRKGARAGDLLLCSGDLGFSFTGFKALQKQLAGYSESLAKHRRPMPRLDLVAQIEKNHSHIHALMDCSDGLINDSLLMAGELGLEIFFDKLPIHPETQKMAQEFEVPPQDFALWGGEDYELLISINPYNRDLFPQWHTVGRFTSESGFFLLQGSKKTLISEFKGFQHF